MKLFVGNALWSLIHQADAISSTVLLVLLITSIVSWSVVIFKWIEFKKKEADLRSVLQQLRSVRSIEQLAAIGEVAAETVPGVFITRFLAHLKMALLQSGKKELSAQQFEYLRHESDAVIFELATAQEAYLPILKVAAEVGPLLGLLGTVWGLIHAFVRISQEQNADIVTVAPGIAEALITTLIGLVVAIPALVFYHALARRVQHIEQQLITVAERCERIVRTSLQQSDSDSPTKLAL